MTYDDRLATILGLNPSAPHDRAIRWRQLVDLVARAGPDARSATIDRAIAEIRTGPANVALDARAAAARAIAGRPLSTALLQAFAADRIEVAAPLLAGAAPSAIVRAAASPEVRRFLDALFPTKPTTAIDEIVAARQATPVGQPVPAPTPTPIPTAASAPPTAPSISAAVERIERLRAIRASVSPTPQPFPPALPQGPTQQTATTASQPRQQPASSTMPATPPPDAHVQRPEPVRPPPRPDPLPASPGASALFRWECGPGGSIGWIEGAPRGALVGRSIARADEDEGIDREVERAFARRAPFRDATLTLPEGGAVAGDWLISGVPAFAPGDGRFVGYRGIARRAEAWSSGAAAPGPLDPAALRELVHELKTPLNAIIGFAEIIDGQYLGPAQSGYRARAAEIVVQAQTLLGAIDDLDFAARLRGRAIGELEPSNFSSFFPQFIERMQEQALALRVALSIDARPTEGLCAIDRELAERLLDRFAVAVLAATISGETLRLAVRREDGFCALRLSRPRALDGLSDAELFGRHPDEHADYSLRMVAGLAQIVGGRLVADGGDLVLRLPRAS